jgi:negative regulator of replication initiation
MRHRQYWAHKTQNNKDNHETQTILGTEQQRQSKQNIQQISNTDNIFEEMILVCLFLAMFTLFLYTGNCPSFKRIPAEVDRRKRVYLRQESWTKLSRRVTNYERVR